MFTSFHFPDSGLYLSNGFDFDFDLFWMAWHWKPAIFRLAIPAFENRRFLRLFRESKGSLCYPEKRVKKRLLCWLKACCSFVCSLAACFAYHSVTTRRESWFPLLPLLARATYSSVITTKNGSFQFFFLIRSSELSQDGSYHFLYTLS